MHHPEQARGRRPNAITVKRKIKTVSALFFLRPLVPPMGEEHQGTSPAPWAFKQGWELALAGCNGSRMLPHQSKGLLHDATSPWHRWKAPGLVHGLLTQHGEVSPPGSGSRGFLPLCSDTTEVLLPSALELLVMGWEDTAPPVTTPAISI